MRIPATLHYSMLLLPFAVSSHMFLSWQVNGSDGMYKYEEIILERVSFTSLHLTVPSTFNMSLFDVFSWGRMDFSPLGGSNSSVGLKKMRAKEKSFLSESHVILSVGEVIGVTPLHEVCRMLY